VSIISYILCSVKKTDGQTDEEGYSIMNGTCLLYEGRLKISWTPYYSESELCGRVVTVCFTNKVSPRTFQMALVAAPPS